MTIIPFIFKQIIAKNTLIFSLWLRWIDKFVLLNKKEIAWQKQ